MEQNEMKIKSLNYFSFPLVFRHSANTLGRSLKSFNIKLGPGFVLAAENWIKPDITSCRNEVEKIKPEKSPNFCGI
jgi:hypothetical protein